jgi:hypothetical protein
LTAFESADARICIDILRVIFQYDYISGVLTNLHDAPADPQYNCPRKLQFAKCVKGQTLQKFREIEVTYKNGVEIKRKPLNFKFCCEFVPKIQEELTEDGNIGPGSFEKSNSKYNCPPKGPVVECSTKQTIKRYKLERVTEIYGSPPKREFIEYWYCCTPDA